MPSAFAYRSTRMSDVEGDRSEHELGEHHVVHDALPVTVVVLAQDVGQRVGVQRLELQVVDDLAGERVGDRGEQVRLDLGEALVGRDRGGDAARDQLDLVATLSGGFGVGHGPTAATVVGLRGAASARSGSRRSP